MSEKTARREEVDELIASVNFYGGWPNRKNWPSRLVEKWNALKGAIARRLDELDHGLTDDDEQPEPEPAEPDRAEVEALWAKWRAGAAGADARAAAAAEKERKGPKTLEEVQAEAEALARRNAQQDAALAYAQSRGLARPPAEPPKPRRRPKTPLHRRFPHREGSNTREKTRG
jgi:hypothetical protein